MAVHAELLQPLGLGPSDLLISAAPRRMDPAERIHRTIRATLTRVRLAAEGITPEKLLEWKIKRGLVHPVKEAASAKLSESAEAFLKGEAVTDTT